MKKLIVVVFLVVVLSGLAAAQTTANVALKAKLDETLTLAVPAAAEMNFGNLTAGQTKSSTSVGVTTTWLLSKTHQVRVSGYFSTAAALTGVTETTYTIPTSALTPIVGGSTLGSAFSGTSVYELYTLNPGARRGSNTTQLALQLALTDPALDVVADDYAGTLHLQAEIF